MRFWAKTGDEARLAALLERGIVNISAPGDISSVDDDIEWWPHMPSDGPMEDQVSGTLAEEG